MKAKSDRLLGKRRPRYRREAEYAEHFRELLTRSVEHIVRDNGPIGIMLSGGMDSGPVACLAARIVQQTGKPLTAYSWTLPNFPEADEAEPIRACADFAHIQVKLFAGDTHWFMDDPSTWPLTLNGPQSKVVTKLFQKIYEDAAQDGCRVLLQNTFGDALYPSSRYWLIEATRDNRLDLVLSELYGHWQRHGLIGLLDNTAIRHAIKTLIRYRGHKPRAPDWLTSAAAALLDWSACPPEIEAMHRPDQYRSVLGCDVFDLQIGDTTLADRLGVVRCDPYHEWYLIDFMLSAPAYLFERNGQLKQLTREAMRGIVPESIRVRRRGGLLNSFIKAGLGLGRG